MSSLPSTSPVVIAISSRALFDFEEENKEFNQDNDSAYMALQLERINELAQKGTAFRLADKLLRLNAQTHESGRKVEIVLLSRNDPVSGLRVFNSIKKHGLAIDKGIFTRGRNPWGYLHALKAHLFLSANEDDVRAALKNGFSAACVRPSSKVSADRDDNEIRIAFDGDGVLFSDEAEKVYQEHGLDAFHEHEAQKAEKPLPEGPFMPLLQALETLKAMQDKNSPVRIRIGLFTARSAPAHERAIKTLMNYNIRIDEAAFLGNLPKAPFLEDFNPDIFFDDQKRHIDQATNIPSGHVISGVMNNPSPSPDPGP